MKSEFFLNAGTHESLFILCMCWNLYIWMVIENSLSTTADERVVIDRMLTGKQAVTEESVKVVS